MLEEMKERHEKDYTLITSRMDRIQKKTESNARFVIATTAVLTTLVTALQVFPPVFKLLTDSKSSAMIDGVEFNA